ncbi:hypothetical protein ACFSC4_30445 [Deinococcus malanensis]|uniref:hypothetical protein n=1 Tax=Deinococcus malanensis TaxID=1706855 RepID=UPI003643411D
MELPVTVQEVAAYAPDAPAVTEGQILEARDWAESKLERAGAVLEAGSREERAAKRAVMNYALHLVVGRNASSLRTKAGTTSVIQERKKLGDLETERKYADGQDTATGYLSSAGEYLSRAWQGLRDAGLPVPVRVGTSR